MLPFIDFVPVRKEHLQKGTAANCVNCAVALALKDKFNVSEVMIGSTNISYIQLHNHQVAIEVSETVKILLKAFDRGIQLRPTVLIIEFYVYGQARLMHMTDFLDARVILDMKPEHMRQYKELLKEVENA